jgi:hypothetical protein
MSTRTLLRYGGIAAAARPIVGSPDSGPLTDPKQG